MSRNNTGNPIGSKAFADFEDNVKNLDEAVNTADPKWVDRFGRFRLPLMEQERQFVSDQERREGEFQTDQSSREAVFSNFLQASGYQDLGEYAPGIEITAHNQYVTFGGQPYLLKPSIPVPYTTSGEWTGDDFKLIGDDSLRQDFANPDKGALMVRGAVIYANTIAGLQALDTSALVDGQEALGGGAPYRWDATSLSWKAAGNLVYDSDFYGGLPETVAAAKLRNSDRKILRISLPGDLSEKLVISRLENASLYLSGNTTASVELDAMLEFQDCKNLEVFMPLELNGNDLAARGINKSSCENVITRYFTIRNIAGAGSTGAGLRMSGCQSCHSSDFVVDGVTGVVARGVYVGIPSNPSYNCSISRYAIHNIIGSGSSTIDGDGIQVQQSDVANFWARHGTITNWNWRAVKLEAPGCHIYDLTVNDSVATNKQSVITMFHGDCSVEHVRGSTVRTTHVIENSSTGDSGVMTGIRWKDIDLSATGDNTEQSIQYGYRQVIAIDGAAIDGCLLNNVNISTDSNYNRGATTSNNSIRTKIVGSQFSSTLSFYGDHGVCIGSSFESGQVHGNHNKITTSSFRGPFLIYGTNAIVEGSSFDAMQGGDSMFDIRDSAMDCVISNNRIFNIESESASPVAIFIRSGALRNVLVYNHYDRRNSSGTKNTRILDQSSGGNTILDRIRSQGDSNATTVEGLVSDFNALVQKLRDSDLML